MQQNKEDICTSVYQLLPDWSGNYLIFFRAAYKAKKFTVAHLSQAQYYFYSPVKVFGVYQLKPQQ